jgi:UDP-glucose 4-epimerase
MNILITGGAGFIGSNIADAYLKEGHKVIIIDDLYSGRLSNVPKDAIYVQMDIRDNGLENLFNEYKIDFVNHQAARGDVRGSLERPREYASVNVEGGVNLLECCRKNNVKGVIYSSTGGCVYGEPVYTPSDELHPIQPRDPYGASKACFEIYLKMYKELYNLNYTIFRYPNVYGPRQNPKGEAGVISIFTKLMLDNKDIIINGDGNQERDFVFVNDVVIANLIGTKNPANTVLNLGTGIGTNVNQIFEILKDITNYTKQASHGPKKNGEVQRSILNSQKAELLWNWKYKISIEEGLRSTVEYIIENEKN